MGTDGPSKEGEVGEAEETEPATPRAAKRRTVPVMWPQRLLRKRTQQTKPRLRHPPPHLEKPADRRVEEAEVEAEAEAEAVAVVGDEGEAEGLTVMLERPPSDRIG